MVDPTACICLVISTYLTKPIPHQCLPLKKLMHLGYIVVLDSATVHLSPMSKPGQRCVSTILLLCLLLYTPHITICNGLVLFAYLTIPNPCHTLPSSQPIILHRSFMSHVINASHS